MPVAVAVSVGLTLQPDEEFLERTRVLLDRVDYAEVAPETLWRKKAGAVVDNGFCDAIAGIVDDAGIFAVAHGVGFSLGACDDDDDRVAVWQEQLRRNHARFGFAWMSDHGGLTTTAGLHLALPIAAPASTARAVATRRKLSFFKDLCGAGAVETSALPFRHRGEDRGGRGDDAALYAASVDGDDGLGVVLDVHNLYTMAQNLNVDDAHWIDDYLSRLDPRSVVEIHVSGGADSDVGWLPGQRTVRLDSHDDDVPDAVFDLLARIAPRCPRLRGVTLERMEGTVLSDDDVKALDAELARIKEILALPPQTPWTQHKVALRDDEEEFDDAAYARAVIDGSVEADNDDGVRVAALLIAKLRFERLQSGSNDAAAEFDDDAAAFVARFKRYHATVPPTAWNPVDEAALWSAFRSRA